jgi:hypothetical protein
MLFTLRKEGFSQLSDMPMTTKDSVDSGILVHITYNGRPCKDIICPVGTVCRQIRTHLADLHSLTSHHVRDDAGARVYSSDIFWKGREYYIHCFCGKKISFRFRSVLYFRRWIFTIADIPGAERQPPVKTSWFPWVQTSGLIKPLKSKKQKDHKASKGGSKEESGAGHRRPRASDGLYPTDAEADRDRAISQQDGLPTNHSGNALMSVTSDVQPRAKAEKSVLTASPHHDQLPVDTASAASHSVPGDSSALPANVAEKASQAANAAEKASQVSAITTATMYGATSWTVIHIIYNGRPCKDIACPAGSICSKIRTHLADLHSLTNHYVKDDTGADVYASQALQEDREYYFHCFCGEEFVCVCMRGLLLIPNGGLLVYDADIHGAELEPPIKTSWLPWVQTSGLIKPVKKQRKCKTSAGGSKEGGQRRCASNHALPSADAEDARPRVVAENCVLAASSGDALSPANAQDTRPGVISEGCLPATNPDHDQMQSANASAGRPRVKSEDSVLTANSEDSLLPQHAQDGRPRAISQDGALNAHADPVSGCCSLVNRVEPDIQHPFACNGLRRRKHGQLMKGQGI